MVCERDPSSPNDPAEGRIGLVRDGEWLTADGTTLGADDGVAIAAMMALVEDESLPHGPLELLMTVAEEVGLEGANGLDPALLSGSILINLDSEEDGVLTVGCAGSTDTWIRIDAPRAASPPDAATLASSRCRRAGRPLRRRRSRSAGRTRSRCWARVLREAGEAAPFRLVSLDGGKSRNAIPRDAHAVCSVPAATEAAFREAVASAARRSRGVREDRRRGASDVDAADDAADPWTRAGTAALLDAVALVPSGPLAHEPDFPASSRPARRSARRSPRVTS